MYYYGVYASGTLIASRLKHRCALSVYRCGDCRWFKLWVGGALHLNGCIGGRKAVLWIATERTVGVICRSSLRWSTMHDYLLISRYRISSHIAARERINRRRSFTRRRRTSSGMSSSNSALIVSTDRYPATSPIRRWRLFSAASASAFEQLAIEEWSCKGRWRSRKPNANTWWRNVLRC